VGSALLELFGEAGPLARGLPGYAPRPQQLSMAEHVAAALDSRETLVVEAGTGTGKTYAYLVPALLSGRRVIISTGTRALQDQLYHRDLPAICGVLGRPVRVALLKGRANYLCRHRLDLAEQQAHARGLRREVAIALPKVRAWSHVTRRGDVAELPGLGEADPVWPWVTSTRENCLGAECPAYDECFVLAARREAQAADIVVVNHHLLMADLVLKEEGFGDLLPGADAVVIDEAHQLPDIAAQFLGYSVSTRQLAAIGRDVAGELLLTQQMGGGVDAAIGALDAQVAAVIAAAGGVDVRLDQAQWPERLLEALNGLAARTRDLADVLAPLAGEGTGAFARLRDRLEESVTRLQALTAEDADGGVRWAEASPRNLSCHYSPVDVAAQLAALLQRAIEPAGRLSLAFVRVLGDGILQLLLVAFIVFFYYRDGDRIVAVLRRASDRLSGRLSAEVMTIVTGTTRSVFIGIVGTAAAQAIVALIGFLIAGVPAAFMLSIATFVLSVVPMGPVLIWGAAAIWLYVQGETGWAIFMVIWGAVVISSIDNFVKPILIARGSTLSLGMIFLGVLGGVIAFGFIGVILGPVLLALGVALGRAWVSTHDGRAPQATAAQPTAVTSAQPTPGVGGN